jgi:hypothetical protein
MLATNRTRRNQELKKEHGCFVVLSHFQGLGKINLKPSFTSFLFYVVQLVGSQCFRSSGLVSMAKIPTKLLTLLQVFFTFSHGDEHKMCDFLANSTA